MAASSSTVRRVGGGFSNVKEVGSLSAKNVPISDTVKTTESSADTSGPLVDLLNSGPTAEQAMGDSAPVGAKDLDVD